MFHLYRFINIFSEACFCYFQCQLRFNHIRISRRSVLLKLQTTITWLRGRHFADSSKARCCRLGFTSYRNACFRFLHHLLVSKYQTFLILPDMYLSSEFHTCIPLILHLYHGINSHCIKFKGSAFTRDFYFLDS